MQLNSKDEQVGTLATDARYRVVYVRHEKSVARVCVEPPPDVGIDSIRKLVASGGNGDITASLDWFASDSMKSHFHRSQGLRLYRSGSFAICNAYMDGALDRAQYMQQLALLEEKASWLIELELAGQEKATGSSNKTPKDKAEKPPPAAE